jgi:hypothetical protein
MMQKKFLVAGTVILLLASCDVRRKNKIDVNSKLTQQVELKDPTTVQIIDSSYNFGMITEGEIVTYNFRFKNIGTKPLIVTNATASCGCTVPEKPEAPIQPGEESFIKVKFNSEKRVGQAHKTVTVTSNAQPAFPELLLTGEVMEKKK